MYNPYGAVQHQKCLKKIKSTAELEIKSSFQLPKTAKLRQDKRNRSQCSINDNVHKNKHSNRDSIQETTISKIKKVDLGIKAIPKCHLPPSDNIGKCNKDVISRREKYPIKQKIKVKKFLEDSSDKESTEQSSFQQIQHVNNQYQLNGSTDIFMKSKKVQFSQKNIQKPQQIRKNYMQEKKATLKRRDNPSPSILKNNSRVLDQSLYSQTERSYSMENSFCVKKKLTKSLKFQPKGANQIIQEKYNKILNNLKRKNNDFEGQNIQKYAQVSAYRIGKAKQKISDQFDIKVKYKYEDQLFPPVYSSLFRITGSKRTQLSENGKQIIWKRLSQLFKDKNVSVFNNSSENSSQIKIFKNEYSYSSDLILGSFNAIKNNRILLQKIFGNQQNLNPYGVYILKIYADNAWKNVIIDDFIPVIKKDTQYFPAFLDVSLSQSYFDTNQPLYIWPFLLEKAYASNYSCYDSLKYGNIVDFLSELTGIPYQTLKIPDLTFQVTQKKRNDYKLKLQRILCLMNEKSIIALGFSDQQLPYVPLFYQTSLQNHIGQVQKSILTYYDPLGQYETFRIPLTDISTLFSKIYFYNTKACEYSTLCHVYPFKNKEDNISIEVDQKIISQSVSVRSFNVLTNTKAYVSISQKQNRFYMRKNSQYLWVRVLFYMKQYDGGYRWINGQYSNKKTITFKETLEIGQYFIIVMPQWKQAHNRQIAVILDSDNQFLKLQRKVYKPQDRLIQLGCMDAAQRYGKLAQVNKSICSYTLVLQKVGLIIENVCNERLKGEVTIMRSISGLKSRCKILPINEEFYVPIPTQNQEQTQANQSKKLSYTPIRQVKKKTKKLRNSIQIDIPGLGHYTVVLKMRGGIDRRFFKAFNFG